MYDDISNKYRKNFESDFDKFESNDKDYENYLKDSKQDYNYNNSDEYKNTKDYDNFEDLEKEMFNDNKKEENLFNRDKYNDFDYEKESKTLERLNKLAEKKLANKPTISNSKLNNVLKSESKSKSNLLQKNNSKSNISSSKIPNTNAAVDGKKQKFDKNLKKNNDYSIENSDILAEIYKNEQEEFEEELRNKHNSNQDEYNYNDEDDPEREEMENEFQYVKSLNEVKDKNKKIEALNKYQSSKIESLQNELEKALNELKTKDLEIESLKSAGKTPSQENRKTLNQINALNVQLDKYKNLISDKKNEINGLMEKINEQQKIIDQHSITDRKHKQEISNKDKQIARLIEEVDKLNSNNINPKNQANNLSSKDIERLTNENKKLEKQKNEIYTAFKKSLKLCSILKRQKVHLENARLLAFTEEEFKQILEQNNKN